MNKQMSKVGIALRVIVSTLMIVALSPTAQASTAYGSLNNFDCVNDTGVEAHGFEIELDDVHSKDVTYTYDYNHYGIPKITEDNSDPVHPKVFIRYAAKRNPDGSWTAYTAVPSRPINPTDGHQFTNPSVNFGGEHFGVGYYGAPSAVKYNWLIDDGMGNLVHGPPVYVATPTFTYYPPVFMQPAQVQAVIVPPPPPDPPVMQFGVATWVKDIKTTTHNPNKVELRDLVDPDPDDPAAPNWANGEPAEVETEWRILQTEFADAGNPKGVLEGVPEDMPDGDEVITRRYEFYKYIGPIDAESGEAMGDEVGPDGIHGVGSVTYNDHIDPMTGEWVEVTVDLTTVEVVGEFFGAQMAGCDVAPVLGLIDHIPDGEIGVAYADRSVVIAGGAAFLATVSGALPDGTMLDGISGVFSGTPTTAGVFTFDVEASDTSGAVVSKSYTVTIAAGAIPPDCNTDAECLDEDACTLDLCMEGACQHLPVISCCNEDEQCDDGVVCTLDVCVNHVCEREPIAGCCSADAECDDGDVCTTDLCVNHVCRNDPIDDLPVALICPAAVIQMAEPGSCSAVGNYDLPIASGGCADVVVSCDPPSGSMFPVGVTTVNCTAANAMVLASCSFDMTVTTGNRCPKSMGFWAKHPGVWPVMTLTLGSQVYNQEELLGILLNPAKADASLLLARQLIAAMLSTANGSDPSPICETVAHANGLLGGYAGKLPYRVKAASAAGQAMLQDAAMLHTYNNKLLTSDCQPW